MKLKLKHVFPHDTFCSSSDGSILLDSASNVSGNGVLHFSGGRRHELPLEMTPLIMVSGEAAVIFAGEELLLGEGLKVTVGRRVRRVFFYTWSEQHPSRVRGRFLSQGGLG